MQQLDDVMNDVSRQSVKTSQSDADTAAEHLSLRLGFRSSSVVLNLTRSRLIDDQTPVYTSTHGHTVRWTAAPANQVTTTYSLDL